MKFYETGPVQVLLSLLLCQTDQQFFQLTFNPLWGATEQRDKNLSFISENEVNVPAMKINLQFKGVSVSYLQIYCTLLNFDSSVNCH